MSYIDQLFGLFTNKERRPQERFGYLAVILLFTIIVDDIFGFSYHYVVDKQIEDVQNLNAIINDPKSDASVKTYASQLRTEVINRKDIVHKIWDSSRERFLKLSAIYNVAKPSASPSRNFILFYFFGNWFFLILVFGTAYNLLDKKLILSSALSQLGIVLLAMISMGLITLLWTWLLTFIPILSPSTWIWNYVVVALLQLFIFLGSYFYFIYDEKRKKEKRKLKPSGL